MRTAKKPGWLHGSAIDLSRRAHTLMFFMLLAITACLCYSQFGIIALNFGPETGLFFTLFLIPTALCVVMLGIAPGIGLAFCAGMLIMVRSWWTPTTMYDFQMSDPFMSVVGAMLGAMVMAAIVTPAARRWPANLAPGVGTFKRINTARIVSLIVGGLAFSFVFAYVTRGLLYLIVTPSGPEYDYATLIQEHLASLAGPLVFLEALLNGAIVSVVCVASVAFDANRRSGTWKSGLNATFTRWLAFAMLVVFMLASSASFCLETMRALDDAEARILGDLEYLAQQVRNREASGAPVETVAEGYSTAVDGSVVVIYNYTVISANNPEDVGKPASQILSSGNVDNFDFLLSLAEVDMLTGSGDDDQEFYGVRALVDGSYIFIADAPLSKVFASRTATLAYNSLFLLAMLAVVFLVARLLLSRIVIAPIHRTNDTLGLITDGELQRRVNERSVIEFDELSTGINTTVTALRDTIAEVEKRNKQDITAAKAIQESALPREFPPFPDIDRFDIYASMKPARGVGGDFYDFFLIDEARLGFLIADVSGKGIPAALFMMAAKTQIRNYLAAGLPVDEAINAANHQLCNGNDAGMFVTSWIGVLEFQTGALTFVNAGHNPPLLHHDGSWEWMREVSGMPLGLFDGIPYDRHACQLTSEDTIYLYTDGVTEAMNTDGELFSEDRLIQTIGHYCNMNARSVCVGVGCAVTEFALGAEQSDDITMMSLRYGVPPEKRAIMSLPAVDTQLVHVCNFIHEELHRRGAPQSVFNPLDIAAEELFVNVCHYAYPDATPDNPGEVRLEFEYEANPPSLTITLTDDGVPYDPLAAPDAELPEDIATASVGGLGILMAKQSVDEMHYKRVGESNVLTFRKGW